MEYNSKLAQTIIGDYPGERQIRRPVNCLYGTLAISFVCIILVLFSLTDVLLCVLFASIVLPYGFLTFRNDRVAYDEEGITLYTLWGRSYKKIWNEIWKIDVVEEL